MQIGRRAVLLGGAGIATAGAAAAVPEPLAFRLLRHGTDIGRHQVSFATKGDALTVTVTVDALVTLMSIPIVRYTHRAQEIWQGGRLVSLHATTDKNGSKGWADARRVGGHLLVAGSKTPRYLAPDNAIGTSYWNKRMLDGPMISLEDGVLLHPAIAVRPPEPIKLASGALIPAAHYNLSGAFNVDVWYDHTDTWAGLAFSVADGSTVHYERL
jgi:hypothetical protein